MTGRSQGRRGAPSARVALLLAGCMLAVGCATSNLDRARLDFYRGRLPDAVAALEDESGVAERDRVLFLMERGTIHQAAGDYERSAADFVRAYDLLRDTEAYSVSEGVTSLVINDMVRNFRGYPFERTYVHVLAALSHLSTGNWDHAAVEGRRILNSLDPEQIGDYPEDAFSRYLAGFALEMMGDASNARVQYRRASALHSSLRITEHGHPYVPAPLPASEDEITAEERERLQAASAPPPPDPGQHELVVFVLAGRTTEHPLSGIRLGQPRVPYAQIMHRGIVLGRSYTLTDTTRLAQVSEEKRAALQAAKTVTRVLIKEAIAESIRENNESLGLLARFILIGLLEQPDIRRWETLPRYMQVARVPCPPDLDYIDVALTNADGVELRRVSLNAPLHRGGRVFVSFVRFY